MLQVPHYSGAFWDVLGVFQVSGEQFFADVARDILVYVSRDLSDKVRHPFPC
jgi:hypothetical protein